MRRHLLIETKMTDSDSDTFSESSSSEYQEDIDYLYGGQARSILSSLEESIGKIDDFLSFERTFVYGDVVCSLSDPSGQMGRVTGVDVLVDLENVKGNILKNVNSKTLLKIRSISEGDYVIKGPWLGQVQRVVDKVTVLLDDGLKCEIIALGKEKLLPVTHHILEDSQYLYYPGQRVKVNSATVSKSARWICGTWRDNKDEGTVCAVEAGLVYVEWLASALLVSNVNVSSPPSWQDSENLTLLSCFSHANWQLSDWCMLQVADQKELMEQLYLSNEHGMTQGYGRRKLNSNVGELFIVSKKKTKVDIIWQNGEHTLGLYPQNLVPVNVINTHEFWPHQFVLEKGASSDDLLKPSSQRWGVVLSMDAKERTVNVQWKTVPVSEPDNLAVDTMIETVSAYELVEHPDFSFCFGDIVFKDQQELAYPADKDNAKPMTDVNLVAPLIDRDQNQNNFPGNCYLSCIGNVTGFKDGDVEVKWATGLTTKVAPSEIFRIDKHESSTVTPNPYEANLEELPQEMNEHGSPPSDQKGKGLLNFDGGRENCDQHSGESSSFSLPQMAYEFFSSIKTSIFQTLGVTSLSRAVSLVPTFDEGNGSNFLGENVLDTCDPCTESHSMNGLQSTEDRRTPYDEVTMTHERNDFPVSSGNNSPDRLKQFDIIDNCSDHHFFDEGKGLALSQVKSGWVKKVQQEWSILENNLPESIYVRVFEERMDLMRAAIVGASGTPYHDGLFFFDICFPLGYPSEPPMVHFNSGGLRLNPNLYESGKVCLSLLNTWTGTSTEVWNPGTSTILQVLISLQALVLNDKPYFNEAGYDQQIGRAEGERNSVSYNENAFLVTCKSMLYLLRKPPKHFEAVVEEHFRQRSRHILVACNAYLEGVTIGCGFGSGNHEDENQKVTSTGFKIMLGKLFPKLVEAFSDKGIDCSQFNELHK